QMVGGEGHKSLQLGNDGVGDDDGFDQGAAAVDDPVPDRRHLLVGAVACKPAQQRPHRGAVVRQVEDLIGATTVPRLDAQAGAGLGGCAGGSGSQWGSLGGGPGTDLLGGGRNGC